MVVVLRMPTKVDELSEEIAIIGYGETPVSRGRQERGETALSLEEYTAWAADLALRNAGLEKKDLDSQGLVINGSQYSHAEIFSAEVPQNLGISPKYVARADAGGASAIVQLIRAASAIREGTVDIVLCVSADAPMSVTWTGVPGLYFGPGYEYDGFADLCGMQGPKAMFAFVMRRHMYQYGTTLEQAGKVAVSHRFNALLNPQAYFKTPITLDDYLSSPIMADPIRLLDNVMLVNGGAAFVVTSLKSAKKLTNNFVRVLGTAECYNYYHGDRNRPDITTTGICVAAKDALKKARLEIRDVQIFEPYDDFPIAVIMQIEDAGFCKKGQGGKFVEETDITVRGGLPINTGGGQLSAGQPGLTGGHVMLVETVRQLMGEGGERQVKDVEIGMATGIGGLGYARNIQNTCVAILGRG